MVSGAEVGQIPLLNRRGVVVARARVDLADLPRLQPFTWRLHGRSTGRLYAYRYVRIDGHQRHVWMHREVLGLPVGLGDTQGDHVNRDTLDNRRENLRIVTPAQNLQNKGSYRGATSTFRGVHWDGRDRRWRAEVRLNGCKAWSKYFTSEDEAAAAVSAKRRELMPFAVEEAA